MDESEEIDEETLEELYNWVDKINFSRPKKDIRRDFSDGVLLAELIHQYCPRIVEIHNYSPANKATNKIANWKLMNRKVFRKLGFELGDDVINNIVNIKPWAVERMLILVRRKIDRYLYDHKRVNTEETNPMTEADQNYKASTSRDVSYPNTGTGTVNKVVDSTSTGPVKTTLIKTSSLHNLNSINKVKKSNVNDMVPRLQLEEKEQELYIKEETIQILQAKVRRQEHLLHLKDIRIDDLQGRLDNLATQLRPTAKLPNKKR